MYVLRLNHLDLRTCALALADASHRRPRNADETPLSRSLARRLSEVYPVAVAKGEVYVDCRDEEALLLRDVLAEAADGWSVAGSFRYREQAQSLPFTPPEAVLARLEA